MGLSPSEEEANTTKATKHLENLQTSLDEFTLGAVRELGPLK